MSTDIKYAFSKKVVNPTCNAAGNHDSRLESRVRGLAKSQFVSMNDISQGHNSTNIGS